MGISKSLNRGIKVAAGKYILRQDSDDVSLPKGVKKQVKFMEDHPDFGLLGTFSQTIDKKESSISIYKPPTNNNKIKANLLFDNCFVKQHQLLLGEKILLEVGYFNNNNYGFAEDYELWIKISRKSKVANLKETLVLYRQHSNNFSKINKNKMLEVNINIISDNLMYILKKPNLKSYINNLKVSLLII